MDHTHEPKTSVNKLIDESSPYLRQHATNLVNWYPWGDTAIELARHQDKPILLSIGYSACHWCHVMMHESFMDPDVAATMNRLFINIKVDKEERPDLDKIYQIGHQLLMGHAGGWPLTMFLNPGTLMPYYGGTYFPKTPQKDTADFETLMHKLNEVYFHDKDKIKMQEAHMLAIIKAISIPRAASELPLAESLRHDAEISLQREFDPVNSGFGNEAKFPNCPSLDFLLQSPDPLARHMSLTTLVHMAQGGIYDHLAGGFFRYSVDRQWQIPHFEKMLYDNGQLLSIYAQAYKLTNNDLFKQVVLETGAWLKSIMLDTISGGFYTSIDADSEEQEGLYYIWDLDEIKSILTSKEFASIKKYYQLDHAANFEGQWHLAINPKLPAPATAELAEIKQKLLYRRNERTAPNLDRKILTGWNGLTIKGLTIAGLVFDRQEFLDLADNAIQFIQQQLFVDQQLYATFQDHKPKISGFLDDYAFVLDAVLTFVNDDPDHRYVPLCISLADCLIANFYDTTHGGFFFTSHSAEKLFYRPKTFTDDATPGGNATACIALLKLGKLLKKADYVEIVKKSIYCAQAFLNDAPEVHLTMLTAYAMLHED